MNIKFQLLSLFALCAFLLGCGGHGDADHHDHGHDHGHSHGESHAHEDSNGQGNEGQGDGHAHGEEVALGTFTIGDLSVQVAQAHGAVEPGKEGHLVVKLPYNDQGETVLRAWIGGEDRTLSSVGKGEFSPSQSDYDIHMVAPDPLPLGAKWWIEIEQPNGSQVLGSIPLLKDVSAAK